MPNSESVDAATPAATARGQHHAGLRVIAIYEIIKTACLLLVALGYAVLFGIEGVGLWLGKHWAEWFTVIATGSLIPLELYETLYHFGWIKLATLVGNVAIIVYLVRIALQPGVAPPAGERPHTS